MTEGMCLTVGRGSATRSVLHGPPVFQNAVGMGYGRPVTWKFTLTNMDRRVEVAEMAGEWIGYLLRATFFFKRFTLMKLYDVYSERSSFS